MKNYKLPKRYVITTHALGRMSRVTENKQRKFGNEIVVKAWKQGRKPPACFDKDSAIKNTFFLFLGEKENYFYKYYGGLVWVFVKRWSRELSMERKYLITVYDWRKNVDKKVD